MIGTEILGHLKSNRFSGLRIDQLNKLGNGFQHWCYLALFKTENVG